MNTKLVEDIASAILYEGYLLYPYRASAIKNRQRWNFGVLYPRAYAERQSGADSASSQTECLVRAGAEAKLNVRLRFLELDAARQTGGFPAAHARDIALLALNVHDLTSEPGRVSLKFTAVEAEIEVTAEPLANDLFKIRVTILNTSDFTGSTRDQALLQSLISTHTILNIAGGEFISLLDPPDELRAEAAACANVGTWPVWVGDPGERDTMLSSPIILYDYPQIAPESPGALFDGTEIDEILTLRILTLTDQEKLEMGLTDDRAREILERTESMPPEQFMKMHGVLRGVRDVQEELP
jgi:hypothetical protein